jgi:hypothetical protein
MDLGPQDRAIARSDEPEARSAARWRGRAGGDPPARLAERWALLESCSFALPWLEMQRDLGRSPRTIDAYARSLIDYLSFCQRDGVDVVAAGRAGALHIKPLLRLTQPTTSPLPSRELRRQLLPARLALELILGGVDR